MSLYKKFPLNDKARSAITEEWNHRGRPDFWPYDMPTERKLSAIFTNNTEFEWLLGSREYDRFALAPRTQDGGIGTIGLYYKHQYDSLHYRHDYLVESTEVHPVLPPWKVKTQFGTGVYPDKSVVLDLSRQLQGFAACGARLQDRVVIRGTPFEGAELDNRAATGPLNYQFFVGKNEIVDYITLMSGFPRTIFYRNNFFYFGNSDGFSPAE